MENSNEEMVTSTIAVEEGKEETSNTDGKVVQPETNEQTQPFKVFTTQNDFDNEAGKIRGSVERKLLKQLGIKDVTELEKVRLAYEASLTQEEKNAQALAELDEIKKQSSRKDYVINALAKQSNESLEDVEKQVTMAESLVNAGMYESFNDAFEYVRELKKPATETKVEPKLPQSKPMVQPDTTVVVPNPFIKGSAEYSLSEQTRLFKENPELARKLKAEANK